MVFYIRSMFVGLLVLLITSVIAWKLSPVLPTVDFYGPYRWWNSEVIQNHTLHIVSCIFNVDTLGGLGWPTFESKISICYRIPDADFTRSVSQLRFLPDSFGYVSFPPFAFWIYWILTGLGSFASVASLEAISFGIALLCVPLLSGVIRVLLEVGVTNHRFTQLAPPVLASAVLLVTPLGMHNWGFSLWVHEFLLLMTLLGLWNALHVRAGRRGSAIELFVVSVLPWVTWSGVIVALALMILRTSFHNRNLDFADESTSIARLRLPRIALASLFISFALLIGYFATVFKDPLQALNSVLNAASGRSYVESSAILELGLSLFQSFGLFALSPLVAAVLIFRMRSRFDDFQSTLLIACTTAILTFESFVLPQHSIIYPFAQLMFVPLLAVSTALIAQGILSRFPQARWRLSLWLALLICVVVNVVLYQEIYDFNRGYFA